MSEKLSEALTCSECDAMSPANSRTTTLMSLPNELVLELFKRFPVRLLLLAEQTCKRFRQLVAVSFDDMEHLAVKDLPHSDSNGVDAKKIMRSILFRCGKALRSLEFGRNGVAFNITALVFFTSKCPELLAEKCPNLNEINITHGVLAMASLLRYAKAVVGGCQLKVIKNSSRYLSGSEAIGLKLIQECPQVRKVSVYLHSNKSLSTLTEILVERSKDDKNHLTDLTLKVTEGFTMENFIKIINASPHLRNINLRSSLSRPDVVNATTPLVVPKQLQNFQMSGCFSSDTLATIRARYGHTLTSLRITCELHISDQDSDTEDLELEFESLTKLYVNSRFDAFDELCRYEFPALRHFIVTTPFKSLLHEENILLDFIKTVGSGLKTLELLHFMSIQSEAIETIVTKCPNLEFLTLVVLPNTLGEEKVSEGDIISLLLMYNMQRLRIYGDDDIETLCRDLQVRKETIDYKCQLDFEYKIY